MVLKLSILERECSQKSASTTRCFRKKIKKLLTETMIPDKINKLSLRQ